MGTGRRVLIIDDEPMVRRSMRRLLERLGYVACEADGGEAGLELLSREPFAALLVDLAMPGMSGGEVLRCVKERWPSLPVLVLTGYAPDDDSLKAASAVLLKPFTLEALRGELERCIPADA